MSPTIKYELKEMSVQQAVSSYIVRSNLLKINSTSLRVEIGDSRQEDGSLIINTLADENNEFTFEGENMVYCIIKTGTPVSGRCHDRDATIYEQHYISSENMQKINRLVKASLDEKTPDIDKRFATFIWNARNEIWRRDGSVPYRDIDSVILEPEIKKQLVDDLNDFTSRDTTEWYAKHYIPFKRGYLFYGKPGTGKTSTISAIATYLNRRVYRLNLVAPGLCDNSLLEAVNSVKKNSVLVMEDVDALFGIHREKNETFSTTFSGLLNAIDGLGDAKGHIFIMTTNHPEKIDPALRRKGRIDLELEFKACSQVQAKHMFLKFFPGEDTDADKFCKQMQDYSYTPAQLQHHFIHHRNSTSSESIKIDKNVIRINENTDLISLYG